MPSDWTFVAGGETVTVQVDGRIVLTDLDAIGEAALAGLGLARLGAHQVLPYLDDGRLVRVLDAFPAPVGAIQVYYAQSRLTPPKVRAFVDFLSEMLVGSACPLVALLRCLSASRQAPARAAA